ncbi:BLUF domain-containing protein [Roseateles sp. LYH14W]|uniref:BLUF domain-containing protein n=1 Tax=Pelomonas parva TaxID=3299032 RepID=A0ABW7F5Y0_9BURK
MPHQLIYSSTSSTPMQQEDLEDILERAQRNNARSGVTGALVYVDGCFLQVLEGEEGAVQGLMERISVDLRHENVTVLQAQAVDAAAFANWKMAYVSATSAEVALWAGLSARTELAETLENLRIDRQRTMQALDGILSVLLHEQRASLGGAQ